MWRDRMVEVGEVAPVELMENPRNWRLHPNFQKDAIRAVLEQVGLVDDIVVNRRTGFVIDGHMRVALALESNQPSVPVVYVDLDDAEETLILAALDPTSLMAQTDYTKLTRLLDDVQVTDVRLNSLLGNLRQHDAFPVPAYEGEEIEHPQSKTRQTKGAVVLIVIGPYRAEVALDQWQIWQDCLIAQTGAAHDSVCEELRRRLHLPAATDEGVTDVA